MRYKEYRMHTELKKKQVFPPPPSSKVINRVKSDDRSLTSNRWHFSPLFTQVPWAALQCQNLPARGTQHEIQSQAASLLREDVRNRKAGGQGKTTDKLTAVLWFGLPRTQKTAAPAPANQKTGRETAPARLIWWGTVSSLPVWPRKWLI